MTNEAFKQPEPLTSNLKEAQEKLASENPTEFQEVVYHVLKDALESTDLPGENRDSIQGALVGLEAGEFNPDALRGIIQKALDSMNIEDVDEAPAETLAENTEPSYETAPTSENREDFKTIYAGPALNGVFIQRTLSETPKNTHPAQLKINGNTGEISVDPSSEAFKRAIKQPDYFFNGWAKWDGNPRDTVASIEKGKVRKGDNGWKVVMPVTIHFGEPIPPAGSQKPEAGQSSDNSEVEEIEEVVAEEANGEMLTEMREKRKNGEAPKVIEPPTKFTAEEILDALDMSKSNTKGATESDPATLELSVLLKNQLTGILEGSDMHALSAWFKANADTFSGQEAYKKARKMVTKADTSEEQQAALAFVRKTFGIEETSQNTKNTETTPNVETQNKKELLQTLQSITSLTEEQVNPVKKAIVAFDEGKNAGDILLELVDLPGISDILEKKGLDNNYAKDNIIKPFLDRFRKPAGLTNKANLLLAQMSEEVSEILFEAMDRLDWKKAESLLEAAEQMIDEQQEAPVENSTEQIEEAEAEPPFEEESIHVNNEITSGDGNAKNSVVLDAAPEAGLGERPQGNRKAGTKYANPFRLSKEGGQLEVKEGWHMEEDDLREVAKAVEAGVYVPGKFIHKYDPETKTRRLTYYGPKATDNEPISGMTKEEEGGRVFNELAANSEEGEVFDLDAEDATAAEKPLVEEFEEHKKQIDFLINDTEDSPTGQFSRAGELSGVNLELALDHYRDMINRIDEVRKKAQNEPLLEELEKGLAAYSKKISEARALYERSLSEEQQSSFTGETIEDPDGEAEDPEDEQNEKEATAAEKLLVEKFDEHKAEIDFLISQDTEESPLGMLSRAGESDDIELAQEYLKNMGEVVEKIDNESVTEQLKKEYFNYVGKITEATKLYERSLSEEQQSPFVEEAGEDMTNEEIREAGFVKGASVYASPTANNTTGHPFNFDMEYGLEAGMAFGEHGEEKILRIYTMNGDYFMDIEGRGTYKIEATPAENSDEDEIESPETPEGSSENNTEGLGDLSLENERRKFAELSRDHQKAVRRLRRSKSKVLGRLYGEEKTNEREQSAAELATELENQRGTYHLALKQAAFKKRDSLITENISEADQVAEIFTTFVIEETKRVNEIKAESNNTIKKTWRWYTNQPPWIRASINATAIGAAVFATGGSGLAAAGISLAKAGTAEGLSQTLFKDKTKQKILEAEEAMKSEQVPENTEYIVANLAQLETQWKERVDEIKKKDPSTKRMLTRLAIGGFFTVDNYLDLEITSGVFEEIKNLTEDLDTKIGGVLRDNLSLRADAVVEAGSTPEGSANADTGKTETRATETNDTNTDTSSGGNTEQTPANGEVGQVEEMEGAADQEEGMSSEELDRLKKEEIARIEEEEAAREAARRVAEAGEANNAGDVAEAGAVGANGAETNDANTGASSEGNTEQPPTGEEVGQVEAADKTAELAKLPPEAIVQKGDGISQIIQRQLDVNQSLLDEVYDVLQENGFTGERSTPEMYRELMEKYGYMTADGKEIRISANMIGEGGYQITVEDGAIKIHEVNLDGNEQHVAGAAFEGKDLDKGEYLFGGEEQASVTQEAVDDLGGELTEAEKSASPQSTLDKGAQQNISTTNNNNKDALDLADSGLSLQKSTNTQTGTLGARTDLTDPNLGLISSEPLFGNNPETAVWADNIAENTDMNPEDVQDWYEQTVEAYESNKNSPLNKELSRVLKGKDFLDPISGEKIDLERLNDPRSAGKTLLATQSENIPTNFFTANNPPAITDEALKDQLLVEMDTRSLGSDQITMLQNLRLAYGDIIKEILVRDPSLATMEQLLSAVKEARAEDLVTKVMQDTATSDGTLPKIKN